MQLSVLLAIADQIKGGTKDKETHEDIWRTNSVAERLKYALMKGITDFIEDDINEALPLYPSTIQIIEGPLMDGMRKVGELFGEGKNVFASGGQKCPRDEKSRSCVATIYRTGKKRVGRLQKLER